MADYDKFIEKLQKISAKLPAIRRILRILIVVICVALLWGIISLLRRGSFVSVAKCESITYGEELTYSAKAYKSDVTFFFATEESDKWTEEVPYMAGKYTVKAISKTIWNTTKESTCNFEIKKRDLSAEYEGSAIEYDSGETPLVKYTNLAKDDRISDERIRYSLPEYVGKGQACEIISGDITVINGSGKDVTECYNILSKDCTFDVVRKKITVAPKNITVEYDGTEQSCMEIEEISGSIGGENTCKYSVKGSILLPGKVETSVGDFAVYDASGKDITEYYDIKTVPGEICVIRRQITVAVADSVKVYDDALLNIPGYEITGGSLLEGDSLTATFSDLPSHPGEGTLQVNFEVIRGEEKVSDCYEISVEGGNYKIEKRPITVETASASKVYDGKDISNNRLTVSEGSLCAGHEIRKEKGTSVKDAGEEKNVIPFSIFDKAGNDVTENYEITDIYGILKIEKRVIQAKSRDATVVYTGNRVNEGLIVDTKGTFVEGHFFVFTDNRYVVNPGTYDNTFIPEVYESINDSYSRPVTANYEFITTYGVLTVVEADPHSNGNQGGKGSGSDGDEGEGSGYGAGADKSMDEFNSTVTRTPDASTEEEDKPIFKVKSDISTSLYLRAISKGDYKLSGEWQDAMAAAVFYNDDVPHFAANVLNSIGLPLYNVSISKMEDEVFSSSLVPYYAYEYEKDYETDIKTKYSNKSRYDFSVIEGNVNDFMSIEDNRIYSSSYENQYGAYVKEHYLNVDPQMEAFFNKLIDDAGIDRNSKSLITDVAEYIQNAAEYNKQFAPFPENEDPVIYFLTEAKEGICQHFASAATLMYRVLGIPARYTMGYMVNCTANSWYAVTSEMAHAWPEVYIDDIGWVAIEVTASMSGDSEMDDDGTELTSERGKIRVRMSDAKFYYNGEPRESNEFEIVSGGLVLGDTFHCQGSATEIYVGIYENLCADYYITDKNGKIVTDEYTVECTSGTLQIMPLSAKGPFSIEFTERVEYVDLTEYTWNDSGLDIIPNFTDIFSRAAEDFFYIEDNKLIGYASGVGSFYAHYDDIDYNGDGQCEITSDRSSRIVVRANVLSNINIMGTTYDALKFKDLSETTIYSDYLHFGENGNKLAENTDTGLRTIFVVMGSDTKEYDGDILYADYGEVVRGELYPGDRLDAISKTSIIYAGTVENQCAGIHIYDSKGNDVTSKYMIYVFNGNLTVEASEVEKVSEDLHMKRWTAARTDKLFEDVDDNISNWKVEVVEGTDTVSLKNRALSARKIGEAVLKGYNEKDINGDGIIDCKYYVTKRVIVEKSMVGRGVLVAGLLLIAGLLVYNLKKEDKAKDNAA